MSAIGCARCSGSGEHSSVISNKVFREGTEEMGALIGRRVRILQNLSHINPSADSELFSHV